MTQSQKPDIVPEPENNPPGICLDEAEVDSMKIFENLMSEYGKANDTEDKTDVNDVISESSSSDTEREEEDPSAYNGL